SERRSLGQRLRQNGVRLETRQLTSLTVDLACGGSDGPPVGVLGCRTAQACCQFPIGPSGLGRDLLGLAGRLPGSFSTLRAVAHVSRPGGQINHGQNSTGDPVNNWFHQFSSLTEVFVRGISSSGYSFGPLQRFR